jgi:outer membrane protein OmpA-like peptidoglycan-associated protein
VSARFGVEPRLPERDSDGDHIPDRRDRCPNQAEDLDGFQDEDGCPDDDNDGDGILDEEDDCPDLAEDKNGIVDEDGCPEGKLDAAYDQDGDGIEDTQDKCPTEPEDRDGFQDEDGCPDLDNDGDQIPDAKDLCPNEPETENGYADGDGCPDEDQVRVVGGEIVLDEVVRFATNSAEISKESDALLGRLAKLIREHPEYVHISIEGHADMRGTEQQNVALSADRARAVLDRLVKEGVAPGRLSSKGFGSSRPRVPGKNDAALAKNRRVEFVVTRAGDSKKEVP